MIDCLLIGCIDPGQGLRNLVVHMIDGIQYSLPAISGFYTIAELDCLVGSCRRP
ncbi:MAG: hypothetical protein A4E42_01023 [Methanoregulaceae archaeon PtaU1.Bin222]|nr:MAG: hypothetical protein A4E42_01023 [Methanoregulaceae archaeon PtaU1.Bin222]